MSIIWMYVCVCVVSLLERRTLSVCRLCCVCVRRAAHVTHVQAKRLNCLFGSYALASARAHIHTAERNTTSRRAAIVTRHSPSLASFAVKTTTTMTVAAHRHKGLFGSMNSTGQAHGRAHKRAPRHTACTYFRFYLYICMRVVCCACYGIYTYTHITHTYL